MDNQETHAGVHGATGQPAKSGEEPHRPGLPDSANTGEDPALPLSASPVLQDCRNLLMAVTGIGSPFRELAKNIKQFQSHEEEIICAMKSFKDSWEHNENKITHRWDYIERHYPFYSPLCTVKSHAENEALGKCSIEQEFEEERKRVILKTVRMDVFQNDLPGESENVRGHSYFERYWALILNQIITFTSSKTKLENSLPENVMIFGQKWMQTGPLLQLIWQQALSTYGFKYEPEGKCYYQSSQAYTRAGSGPAPDSTCEPMEVETAGSPEVMRGSQGVAPVPAKRLSVSSTGVQTEEGSMATRNAATGTQQPQAETVPRLRYEALQKDKDSLQQQVQYYSKKIDQMKKQASEHEQQMAQLQLANHNIAMQNQELESSNVELNKQWTQQFKQMEAQHKQQLVSERTRIDQQVRSALEERAREIHQLKQDAKRLKEEKDKLLNSVSTFMNQQMSRDESDLENINVKNRPMKLLDDFSLFVSQEWLEAKTTVDDWLEEKEYKIEESNICSQITESMMECNRFADTLYGSTKQHFADILQDPLQPSILSKVVQQTGGMGSTRDGDAGHTQQTGGVALTRDGSTCYTQQGQTTRYASVGGPMDTTPATQKPGKPLDADLVLLIAKTMKTSSDHVDFTEIAKDMAARCFSEISGFATDDSLHGNQALVEFFAKCLKMCWRMVLQQPPMKFECLPGPGGEYAENMHELHFGSADPKKPNMVIHYYIHPGLFHGTKQMKKARVILHVKPKDDVTDMPGGEGNATGYPHGEGQERGPSPPTQGGSSSRRGGEGNATGYPHGEGQERGPSPPTQGGSSSRTGGGGNATGYPHGEGQERGPSPPTQGGSSSRTGGGGNATGYPHGEGQGWGPSPSTQAWPDPQERKEPGAKNNSAKRPGDARNSLHGDKGSNGGQRQTSDQDLD